MLRLLLGFMSVCLVVGIATRLTEAAEKVYFTDPIVADVTVRPTALESSRVALSPTPTLSEPSRQATEAPTAIPTAVPTSLPTITATPAATPSPTVTPTVTLTPTATPSATEGASSCGHCVFVPILGVCICVR